MVGPPLQMLTTLHWYVWNLPCSTVMLAVITLNVTAMLYRSLVNRVSTPFFPSSSSVLTLDYTLAEVISSPPQHLVVRLMQEMEQLDVLTRAQNVNDTPRLPRDRSPLRYGTLGRLDYPIKMRRCLFSNIFVTAPLQGCSSLHLFN